MWTLNKDFEENILSLVTNNMIQHVNFGEIYRDDFWTKFQESALRELMLPSRKYNARKICMTLTFENAAIIFSNDCFWDVVTKDKNEGLPIRDLNKFNLYRFSDEKKISNTCMGLQAIIFDSQLLKEVNGRLILSPFANALAVFATIKED